MQYDHHAFLFWPPTRLAVLPVQIGGGGVVSPAGGATPNQPFVGAIGYRVDQAGIAELGRISHDPVNGLVPPIERSLVIGNRLLFRLGRGVRLEPRFARAAGLRGLPGGRPGAHAASVAGARADAASRPARRRRAALARPAQARSGTMRCRARDGLQRPCRPNRSSRAAASTARLARRLAYALAALHAWAEEKPALILGAAARATVSVIVLLAAWAGWGRVADLIETDHPWAWLLVCLAGRWSPTPATS